MAEPSQELLQLDSIQAQLASENPVLHATSKIAVTHLNFNAFLGSRWMIASGFPHVQIGVRNGQPVHAFATRDAFCTIAPGGTPVLKSIDTSCETLEDVDLVAPFDRVEEWKSELSGSLSREFRALLKYLFLLHVAEGGPDKNLGLRVDVEDLKVALVMVHQARQSKVSSSTSGSVDASGAESTPEPSSIHLLSGPTTTKHHEPTTEPQLTDQSSGADVDPAPSDSMQLNNHDVDRDSSIHAARKDLSRSPSRQGSTANVSGLPLTDGDLSMPSPTPTPTSMVVPVLAQEGADDEPEGIVDATTDVVPQETPNETTTQDVIESSDDEPLMTRIQAKHYRAQDLTSGSALHDPVKGTFTVNGPGRARPPHKQIVPVAEDTSDTESGYFIASNRKNFRNKSKPPDDRRTEDAAKAIRFAEDQAGSQRDTPASDEGMIGYDGYTDIEIVDDPEPDEDAHQSSLTALSKFTGADAETQHDADSVVDQNSRPRRNSNQGLLHNALGNPIERVAF